MRRGTVFLFLFIAIAALVIGLSVFLRSQPALEITLSVSPLAEAWLHDAAASFNASGPTINSTQAIRITVQPQEDAPIALGESGGWTADAHPDGWIPAAGFSLAFARGRGLPLSPRLDSVAQTPLVWGGFSSSVNTATGDGAQPFDWPAVNEAVATQFVRLAFRSPSATIDGFAVLLSGAAAFSGGPTIDRAALRSDEGRAWLENTVQAVPNTATLGASAAQTMAARGPSVGSIALLPESEWLANLRGQLVRGADPLKVAYPEYTVWFTFPCAAWSDPTTTAPTAADRAKAVEAFCAYLLTPAQQQNAARFGLRPISGLLDPETATTFSAAAQYGILLELLPMTTVEAPSRSDAQLLALTATQFGS